MDALGRNRQVLLRYADSAGRLSPAANPNGSLDHVAGICNSTRNVFGMMPHPEDASEKLLGSEDGLKIFTSIIAAVERRGQGAWLD
jgi:phosphoribosylformylglycinamidine synthase